MFNPVYEITLKQAAERAHQAEIISRLIELSSDEIGEGDLTAISALLRRLTGDVTAFLVEMVAEEESHNAQSN